MDQDGGELINCVVLKIVQQLTKSSRKEINGPVAKRASRLIHH